MDCALAAREIPGCGPLHAISRRGLLPQAHRHQDLPPVQLPPPPIEYWPTDDRGLVRAFRKYVSTCRNRGYNWREAVTALRPVTARLWQGMDVRGKRRFMEKLLPYWDSHRHRAAPEIAGKIEMLRSSGALAVDAGRIRSVRASGDDLVVEYVARGTAAVREVRAGYVINCTGPETDLTRWDMALVKQMMDTGMLCADELRLGIEADDAGRVRDASGMAMEDLWCIGPLRKAQLWESTAVPEIRVQAEALAKRFVGAG
jgi:uncharacterized NAD(P)/FAD-binding protein YdhS